MIQVLADTGPLYAAAVRSDQYHDRSRQDMARFARSRAEVIVPYPVVFETYTLILRRTRVPVALSWLSQIATNATLIAASPDDYRQATLLVSRYPDQPITLFDALVAVMSAQRGVPVWTFDHHFDVMGADVWRPA